MNTSYKVFFTNTAKFSVEQRSELFSLKPAGYLLFSRASSINEADIVVSGEWVQALAPVVTTAWVQECISRQKFVDPLNFILNPPQIPRVTTERTASRPPQSPSPSLPSTQFGQSTEGIFSQDASQDRSVTSFPTSPLTPQSPKPRFSQSEMNSSHMRLGPHVLPSPSYHRAPKVAIDLTDDIQTTPDTIQQDSRPNQALRNSGPVAIKQSGDRVQNPTSQAFTGPKHPQIPKQGTKATSSAKPISSAFQHLIEDSTDSSPSTDTDDEVNGAQADTISTISKKSSFVVPSRPDAPPTSNGIVHNNRTFPLRGSESGELQEEEESRRFQSSRPSPSKSHSTTPSAHLRLRKPLQPQNSGYESSSEEDSDMEELEADSTGVSPPISPRPAFHDSDDESFEIEESEEGEDAEGYDRADLQNEVFSSANTFFSRSSRSHVQSNMVKEDAQLPSRRPRSKPTSGSTKRSTSNTKRRTAYNASDDSDYEEAPAPRRLSKPKSRKKDSSTSDDIIHPQRDPPPSKPLSSKKRNHHQILESSEPASDSDEKRQHTNHSKSSGLEYSRPEHQPNKRQMHHLPNSAPRVHETRQGSPKNSLHDYAPTGEDSITIYLSGVRSKEFAYEEDEVRKLKLKRRVVLTNDVEKATHFVLSDDPQRTQSSLLAIAHGKWIMRYKWYSTLLRTGEVPAEKDFEFEHWPGAKRARKVHNQVKLQNQRIERGLDATKPQTPTGNGNHGQLASLLFESNSFNLPSLRRDNHTTLIELLLATGASMDSKHSSIHIVADSEWDFESDHPTWLVGGRITHPVSYIYDCIQLWKRVPVEEWHDLRKFNRIR